MSQPLSKRLSIRKALASAFIVALAFSLSPVAKAQANKTPTMIVLDNSGSMTAQDAGGQTRIDAAKQASTQLINDISDRTDVGLTYYGGNTGETEADVEMGCQDVTIVGGPSRGNAGTLIDTINSLQPRGFTPIGKALTDTAAELPEGGNIVLVSDGIANCTPPDVCEVAQELAQSGINLVINTIGLNVDPAAREELECIAGVGGGTYADASDAQSLTDALTRAASRQYNSYTSDVTKIDGASEQSAAVEIDEDTELFLTDLPQESRFWKIPVEPGETISVSANTVTDPTVLTMGQGGIKLEAQLHTEEAPQYGLRGRCTRVSFDNFKPGLAVRGIQNASVASKEVGTNNCDTDAIYLEISRSGDYLNGQDIPTEITIERFGKVDESTIGNVTEEHSSVDLPEAAASEAHPVTPGQWFTSAADLDPAGEKVSSIIVPGETHFYALPVDYGQELRAAVETTFDQIDSSALGTHLYIQAFSPNRAEIELTNRDTSYADDNGLKTFGFFAPVSAANLFEKSSQGISLRSPWQGGTQYLAVTYLPSGQDEDVSATDQLPTLEYELVAEAFGDPVDPPVFASLTGATPSTSTTPSDVAEDEQISEAAEEDSSSFPIVWIGLGVIGLGIIIGLIFALRRKN